MAFCVLSMSQLVHSLNVRSNQSILSAKMPKNFYLYGAILAGIALQVFVVVSPILSGWFATTLLSTEQWKMVVILSVFPIVAVEFSKLFKVRTK